MILRTLMENVYYEEKTLCVERNSSLHQSKLNPICPGTRRSLPLGRALPREAEDSQGTRQFLLGFRTAQSPCADSLRAVSSCTPDSPPSPHQGQRGGVVTAGQRLPKRQGSP